MDVLYWANEVINLNKAFVSNIRNEYGANVTLDIALLA